MLVRVNTCEWKRRAVGLGQRSSQKRHVTSTKSVGSSGAYITPPSCLCSVKTPLPCSVTGFQLFWESHFPCTQEADSDVTNSWRLPADCFFHFFLPFLQWQGEDFIFSFQEHICIVLLLLCRFFCVCYILHRGENHQSTIFHKGEDKELGSQ